MKHYELKITSKNKESLMYFYNYLFYDDRKIQKNFFAYKKHYKSFKNNKVITILKAPHVYKVAQEQFNVLNFKEKYFIGTTNSIKFLKFIKSLKMNKFSDINIILKKISIKNKYNFNNSVTISNYILHYFSVKTYYFLDLTSRCELIFNLDYTKKYLVEAEIFNECKTKI